ncbi:DNA repair protein RecN [Fictibacillus gelatini]|uniref:DNA repair protein RecN n=1 Tax=Fictibacillus gelatini TaxID=225985 RepID=UPI000428E248|nr:DNA repair protein RecN [Fictibacillus gelatini]
MLAELTIRNFAIIDSLTISFQKGLTVLTGETGAGKSIIIDAIGLLIGGRGSSEFVRFGKNKAEIEGLFHITQSHPIHEKVMELGIDITDEMVILKRDITDSGKSVCRINGKLVTLSVLKEVGQLLVDIHGQHETQFLLQPEKHLHLLDSFGKDIISKALLQYKQIYEQYKEITKQLNTLTKNEQQMNQRLDLLQYQLEEIENAKLKPNEDQELLEERIKLGNFEKLYNNLQDAYFNLYGDQKGLEYVSVALEHLQTVSNLDESLSKMHENMANHFYALEEVSYAIRSYFETLEFDPKRLNLIESRLNEISNLKRKYGNTVNEIIDYGKKIKEELELLKNKDGRIDKLKANLEKIMVELQTAALELSNERKLLTDKLKEAIHRELKELYMEKTVFDIQFKNETASYKTPLIDRFGKTGIDEVEFYISTNPGEPLKPLAKVASGGELSRVILALKSIFSQHQDVASIIFDEVDTGVSGRVAQAIAEKIYKVSVGSQVLCITHLPQVAAMADQHLHISKNVLNDRTVTNVSLLETSEKVKEIGRMISGVEITDLTIKHAKELIELAEEIKKSS